MPRASHDDPLSWAVPVMRAGYLGRGLTYLAVAGFSLLALSRGGEAQATGSALARLEAGPGGTIALVVIMLGLFAYALWRGLAALLDLDAHGADGKGLAARAGQAASAVVHLGLALAAVGLLLDTGGSEGDSRIREWVGTVMSWPMGRWLVGLAGLVIIGAGAAYVMQGVRASYERYLRSSPATARLRTALRIGVAAHGVTMGVIGLLFLLAALQADPSQAGGLAGAFDWLGAQAFGRVLVTLLCLGLLAFALFNLVNARWRIVPRVAGDKTETLARLARGLVPT